MAKVITLLAVLVLSGCINSAGLTPMANQSQVKLSDGDYTTVASGLRGEASCFYLFNFIPFGDTALATRAMDELVESADLSGKPRALSNFSYDRSTAFFLLFSVQTAKMRADVVEFR